MGGEERRAEERRGDNRKVGQTEGTLDIWDLKLDRTGQERAERCGVDKRYQA